MAHQPRPHFSRIHLAAVGATIIGCTTEQVIAAGAFSSPVQNTFTINFDGSSATSPGPVSLLATGSAENFDNANFGERAFWGSFGGAPDSIVADIVENIGPNGAGDHAARLTVADTTTGGYFSGLIFHAKGLRLGNSTGLTASGGEPIPDFDAGLTITAPVRTSQVNARFRLNFDTGSQVRAGRYDDPMGAEVTFVQGNFPGLVDNLGAGSRILQFGNVNAAEIGVLPVNTWGTQTTIGGQPVALNENPSSANGWVNATFEPAFSRAPRSFDLTRLGVTFPGSGGVGEVLISEWTLSGPDVMKYHHADFNTDEMVNATDIDMLFKAVNVLTINEALPVVPDNNFNGRLDFEPVFGVNRIPGLSFTFPEKFSITKGDNALNQADIDELVLNLLGTSYGDVDLDGDVDSTDLSTATANLGMPGGWAMGDVNGDEVVNAADIAIINANLPGGLPGDANSDGKVDLLDLDILGANFGLTSGATVAQGDFNSDGGVNLLDLDILGANFGAMAPATVGVPEPGSLLLAAAAASLLLNRRH